MHPGAFCRMRAEKSQPGSFPQQSVFHAFQCSTHLGVQQQQCKRNLQRQAPQLMQAGEQVHHSVSVNAHQRLHGAAGERGHVHRAD